MCCDILGLVRIFQWGVAGGGGVVGGVERCQQWYQEKDTLEQSIHNQVFLS